MSDSARRDIFHQAVMWRGLGMLKRLRAMSPQERLTVMNEANEHNMVEPLWLVAARCQFVVPSWSPEPLTGAQVTALLVFGLWVQVGECEEMAASLVGDWPELKVASYLSQRLSATSAAGPREKRMKILAFLQNQYFRDSAAARRIFERSPERRNDLVARFLFMGCLTGRRLQTAFGEALCSAITWEEISPQIGATSGSAFPADRDHIRSAIEKHAPDVIVCFGKIASDALRAMGLDVPVLYAPHPAARHNPMPALRETAEQLRRLGAAGKRSAQLLDG